MRLQTYLERNDLLIADFADRIGVSPQSVHRYLSGERVPRRDVMERILVATGGDVSANDFFTPARAA